jgi:hypothetical protein
MHRRVRGVVGPGMASVASMAQHGPVGDQGKPVNSQHESMQRHRSDDMGLKDARASESYKADYPMKEAPCGASYSTPSGETIGTGTGKQPEQMLRLRQHPSQGKGCAAPDSATGATGVKRNARSFSGLAINQSESNGTPPVIVGHEPPWLPVRAGVPGTVEDKPRIMLRMRTVLVAQKLPPGAL